jgi:hypothetical protein
MTQPTTSEAYTAKVGFTPLLVFCSVISTGIAAGFGWMALDPQIMTDLAAWLFFPTTIAVFGSVGLALPIVAARHPVALRVDHDGVTLGRPPGLLTQHGLWWHTPRVTVPWRDIDAIVVFDLTDSGPSTVSCIGLRLRAGADLPPGEPTRPSAWQYLNRVLGQSRPPDDVRLFRQIFGWRLDRELLAEAVRAHAHPGVQVVDHD